MPYKKVLPSTIGLLFFFVFGLKTNVLNLATDFSSPSKNSSILRIPLKNFNLPDGKNIYQIYCLTCHQEDGEGVPSMNPPLNSGYAAGEKSKIIEILLKGLKGKVKIDGKYYTNIMASQAFLKDDQIAAVLTYVRSSFGNKASMVLPEDVKQVRSKL